MALGKCRECGKEASTEAKACPHCGAVKPVKSGIGIVRGLLLGFAGLVVISVATRSFDNYSGKTSDTPPAPTALSSPVSADTSSSGELKVEYVSAEAEKALTAPPKPNAENGVDVGKWVYDDWEDQMTSKRTYVALVTADEKLHFEFPYNGGSEANLYIRKHPRRGDSVMIRVEKGHFLCRSYDGCYVNVRFDDKPAVRFAASEPSDHDIKVLFLDGEAKFIEQAKKAKTTKIEAEFYQAGRKVMTFHTANLKWPPAKK